MGMLGMMETKRQAVWTELDPEELRRHEMRGMRLLGRLAKLSHEGWMVATAFRQAATGTAIVLQRPYSRRYIVPQQLAVAPVAAVHNDEPSLPVADRSIDGVRTDQRHGLVAPPQGGHWRRYARQLQRDGWAQTGAQVPLASAMSIAMRQTMVLTTSRSGVIEPAEGVGVLYQRPIDARLRPRDGNCHGLAYSVADLLVRPHDEPQRHVAGAARVLASSAGGGGSVIHHTKHATKAAMASARTVANNFTTVLHDLNRAGWHVFMANAVLVRPVRLRGTITGKAEALPEERPLCKVVQLSVRRAGSEPGSSEAVTGAAGGAVSSSGAPYDVYVTEVHRTRHGNEHHIDIIREMGNRGWRLHVCDDKAQLAAPSMQRFLVFYRPRLEIASPRGTAEGSRVVSPRRCGK